MTIEYDPQNGDAATDIIDIETQEQAKLVGDLGLDHERRRKALGRSGLQTDSPYY